MADLKLSISRAIKAAPSDTIDIPSAQDITAPASAATATTASKLVDSTADFVALEVKIGHIVLNSTDGTMATVLAIDSATILSISADIMANDEVYTIYSATTKSAYFYVGVAGDVTVTTSGNTKITIPNAQVGWHPVNVRRIWITDTTASVSLVGW